MAHEEFEARLAKYGLEPKEAKVYMTLAWGGPRKAGELAKLCSQSRMDTYRVLKRLQSSGLVDGLLSRPMRFAAVPPERAFDILISSTRERISLMEEEKKSFLSLWASVPKLPLDAEEERFRIIRGRVEFFSAVKQLCSAASKSISILTTKNGLSRIYYGGVDDLLETKRGVEVRVLAELDRLNQEAAERFASVASLRHCTPTSAQFFLADGADIVVNMALDDSMSLSSERDTSLWTNSRGYVKLMAQLFDEVWRDSTDAKAALRLIALGQAMPETRVIREAAKIVKKEAEMIASAKRNVAILTASPRVGGLLREPVAEALKACGARGVAVRVLTDPDESRLEELMALSQTSGLRLVDFKSTAETLAVDDLEAMLIGLEDPTGGSGEAAFWTNEKGYVSLMRTFLDQVWNTGHEPKPYLETVSLTRQMDSALAGIGEALGRKGWTVEAPGFLEGGSSVKHRCGLVARRGGEVVALDYVVGATPVGSEPLIAYAAKKVDTNPSRAVLLVVPGADEQSARLVGFFGVELIQEAVVSRLKARALQALGVAE